MSVAVAHVRRPKDLLAGWQEVVLGDLFDISSSRRVLQEQWTTYGVPFYRAREIVKLAEVGCVDNELFISEQLYQEFREKFGVPEPGDLMISAVGTLGACYVVRAGDRFYFKDASVLRLRPKQQVSSQYVWHAFRTEEVLNQVRAGSGSTVGTYTIERAKKTRLRLPTIDEQNRIARILDKADSIRVKRDATIVQLEALTQSIFLAMFGDPEACGWDMTTVGSMASGSKNSIRTGPFGSQLLHSEFTGQGVAVLGIDNAVSNEFRWAKSRYISQEKFRALQRYRVYPGDVLITIMGTCGRCAVVPDDIPVAINTKHLCCITLNRNICSPVFLHAYFIMHPLARSYLARKAKGAVMEGLNMGIIKQMPIPLAPMELQQSFERRVRAVEGLRRHAVLSLNKMEALSASLQHRAFRGEL